MVSQRNKNIDVARGLLIILMVLGHTGFIGTRFIYLFHIPSFVFISGYLHKDDYSFSKLYNRFKSLYFPFVKYSFLFLISINFFVALGIAEIELVTNSNILKKLSDIFLMKGLGSFLGAFWYFTMILEVIFMYVFLDILLKKIKTLSIVIIILTTLMFVFISAGYEMPAYIDRSVLMLFPYHAGRLFKKHQTLFSHKTKVFFLSFIAILIIYFIGFEINIGSRILPNIFIYLISLFSGFFLVMSLSNIIVVNKFEKLFSYLGKNTIIILAFHFFSFKLLDLIIYNFNNLSDFDLSRFPISFDNSIFFSLAYLIIGLSLPILIKRFLRL
jgi:fucose 4-O-acetylase-like acetyltransferase